MGLTQLVQSLDLTGTYESMCMQWARQRNEAHRAEISNRPEAAGGLFCQVPGYEFDRHPEWKHSDCLEDRTEMDAGDSGFQFDRPFR